MFDTLGVLPGDPLLALIGQFRADPRDQKIDLGVGVYRNAEGHTPVMSSVKAAEAHLLEVQETKGHVGPEGDADFLKLLGTLVLDSLPFDGMQTPGGTGALSLAAHLLARGGVRRIWLGLPTWANHLAVFQAAGLEVRTVSVFDPAQQRLDTGAFLGALSGAKPGDAVLLHAC